MIAPTKFVLALSYFQIVSSFYVPTNKARDDHMLSAALLLGQNLAFEVCIIAQETYLAAAALGLRNNYDATSCVNPLLPIYSIAPPLLATNLVTSTIAPSCKLNSLILSNTDRFITASINTPIYSPVAATTAASSISPSSTKAVTQSSTSTTNATTTIFSSTTTISSSSTTTTKSTSISNFTNVTSSTMMPNSTSTKMSNATSTSTSSAFLPPVATLPPKFTTGFVMLNDTITGKFIGYFAQNSVIYPQYGIITPDINLAMMVTPSNLQYTSNNSVGLSQIPYTVGHLNDIYVGLTQQADINNQSGSYENAIYFASNNLDAATRNGQPGIYAAAFVIGNYKNGTYPLSLSYNNSDGTTAYPLVIASPNAATYNLYLSNPANATSSVANYGSVTHQAYLVTLTLVPAVYTVPPVIIPVPQVEPVGKTPNFITGIVMVNNSDTGSFIGYWQAIPHANPQYSILTTDISLAMFVNTTSPQLDGSIGLSQLPMSTGNDIQIGIAQVFDLNQVNAGKPYDNPLFFSSTNSFAEGLVSRGTTQVTPFLIGAYNNLTNSFPLKLQYKNADGTLVSAQIMSRMDIPGQINLYATFDSHAFKGYPNDPVNSTVLTLIPVDYLKLLAAATSNSTSSNSTTGH